MQSIIRYVRRYFYETDKKTLAVISLYTALLVFINYHYGLDSIIRKQKSYAFKLFCWWLVFFCAFAVPYVYYRLSRITVFLWTRTFILLLVLAPLIFALKLSSRFDIPFSTNIEWNYYWNQVSYWPMVGAGITIVLLIIWKLTGERGSFYGLTAKRLNFRPYLVMLACMIPLVAIASTQPDFLSTYPKIKSLDNISEGQLTIVHRLLFEIAYASDFFNIELFFRGFLVFAFLKWAGKDAILPMACFYCTIHFGKPLGECISSYFGGVLLGIVAYETRSILGGLLVHIGIAWMMELGGYIGNRFLVTG